MNEQTHPNGNGIEGEVEILATLPSSSALRAVDSAAIDMQIETARAHPRTVTSALREALDLATLDEQTAQGCFYAMPRGGKLIEGPSARLAEIMLYSWGNLRADADIVEIDRTHLTAMGTCFDLERNTAVRVRVKRRITDRHGRRYNDDMIVVTGNAAISIALRNAIFKTIPMAFTKRIYEAARQASLGKAGTLAQKRQTAIDWFGKAGIKPEQLFALLEVKGVDDIGEDELIVLRGLLTAIKDGETTIEEVFSPPRKSERSEALNEALDKQAASEDEKPEPKATKKGGRKTAGAGPDDEPPPGLDLKSQSEGEQ